MIYIANQDTVMAAVAPSQPKMQQPEELKKKASDTEMIDTSSSKPTL